MCQKENDEEKHPNGRRSEAEVEELRRQVEALQLQADAIQETLDTIKKALLGNGGHGMAKLIDEMATIVEKMGRLFEDSHRQGQLQADVIESLIQKLQIEKVLVDVLAIWQAHKVAEIAAQV